MVRKIKKKKKKMECLDMNNLKDIRPVITYWLNLLGESKEVKDMFKECITKDSVLKKISEMIMDGHEFLDRLKDYRIKLTGVLSDIDNDKSFKEEDTRIRAEEIESSVNSHTAIGYWETLKMMQFFILTSYSGSGRENELPEYGVDESSFIPKINEIWK